MIKRTTYQFDLGTFNDEFRAESHRLAKLLSALIPHSEVQIESVKTDTSILTIEIEEVDE